MTIGQKIAHIRKTHGLTQEAFGEKLGVTRQTVSKWELDVISPSVENIVQICRMFSISTDSLLHSTATVQIYEQKIPSVDTQPKQEDLRWAIVYGSYKDMEALAVNELDAHMSEYVRYYIEVRSADEVDEDWLRQHQPILIGTPEDNRYLKELTDKQTVAAADGEEGYSLTVGMNPWNAEVQYLAVIANTDRGVYYGMSDLIQHYLAFEVFCGYYERDPREFDRPFNKKMPTYSRKSAPQMKRRGMWTWGHCIYDYRRYFDHMARLRLNEIVIWNEFAPVNAREVVEYAHSRGIRVIWGYSWGWGDAQAWSVNAGDRETWGAFADNVVKFYEDNYLDTGADGIYFQSFTETLSRTIGEAVIAEAVTALVNFVAERMYAKYPDLLIQFGLHATSVKNDLEYLEKVHPNIEIVWENCGAFPYSYHPKETHNFPETLDFNRRIATLRGEKERFGAVIKGMTTLPWSEFKSFKGPYVLGERNKHFTEKRSAYKSRFWRHLQSDWVLGARYPYELMKMLTELKGGDLTVQILAEDGMFEEDIYIPIALLAEMLWSTEDDVDTIVERVLKSRDVSFANFEY